MKLAPTVALRVAFHARRVERLHRALRSSATMEQSRVRLLLACAVLSSYRTDPTSDLQQLRRMRRRASEEIYVSARTGYDDGLFTVGARLARG